MLLLEQYVFVYLTVTGCLTFSHSTLLAARCHNNFYRNFIEDIVCDYFFIVSDVRNKESTFYCDALQHSGQ